MGSDVDIRSLLVWEMAEKALFLKIGRTKFDSGVVTLSVGIPYKGVE